MTVLYDWVAGVLHGNLGWGAVIAAALVGYVICLAVSPGK